MPNLNRAHKELFSRQPDECFSSLESLLASCREDRDNSLEHWTPPTGLWMDPESPFSPTLVDGEDGKRFELNDWSFGQFCRLAGIPKRTVNRLSLATASKVLRETVPQSTKPIQLLTREDRVRSLHQSSYTRLFDAELLEIVEEYASDFRPPPVAVTGASGLYRGEQDMFLFLVDPEGAVEIDNQQFSPGMFLWNSEVGRRTVGVETFWYQSICANHIVWDVTDTVCYERKHTTGVRESLETIRELIRGLVRRRDERRHGFARLIEAAMVTTLGASADEALDQVAQLGVSRKTARIAVNRVKERTALTVFNVLDELTKMSQSIAHAGDRTVADQQAGQLLSLAV